jgi:hypothetical protein
MLHLHWYITFLPKISFYSARYLQARWGGPLVLALVKRRSQSIYSPQIYIVSELLCQHWGQRGMLAIEEPRYALRYENPTRSTYNVP